MGRLHQSEKRRFLEGMVQRQEKREEAQRRQESIEQGASPAVADQKHTIEQGQQSARRDTLAEINAEASTASS